MTKPNRQSVTCVAFVRSPRWQAALKREIHCGRFQWALDENELVSQAMADVEAVVVVELRNRRLAALSALKHLFLKRRIFAIADVDSIATPPAGEHRLDRSSADFEKTLRNLGINDVLHCVSQLKTFNQRLERLTLGR